MSRHYTLATVVIVFLILYGGLFPLTGWVPGDPLTLLHAGLHHRVYFGDVFVNLVVFIPFGFCAARATRSSLPSKRSVLLAIALGFLVSLLVEVLQAFLPTRDPSLIDLLANLLGTAVGVVLSLKAHSGNASTHLSGSNGSGSSSPIALWAAGLWAMSMTTPLIVALLQNQVWTWKPNANVYGKFDFADLGIAALSSFGLFAVLLCVTSAPAKTLRSVTIFLAVLMALQLLLGSPQSAFETSVGALLALILATIASRRWRIAPRSARQWALAGFWAISVSFVFSECLPGGQGIYRSFNWIPFRGHLAKPLVGIEAILSTVWQMVALACALHLSQSCVTRTSGIVIGAIVGFVVGFALEYTQTQLPGRYGDITTPLLMSSTWIIAWLAHKSSAVPMERQYA